MYDISNSTHTHTHTYTHTHTHTHSTHTHTQHTHTHSTHTHTHTQASLLTYLGGDGIGSASLKIVHKVHSAFLMVSSRVVTESTTWRVRSPSNAGSKTYLKGGEGRGAGGGGEGEGLMWIVY